MALYSHCGYPRGGGPYMHRRSDRIGTGRILDNLRTCEPHLTRVTSRVSVLIETCRIFSEILVVIRNYKKQMRLNRI